MIINHQSEFPSHPAKKLFPTSPEFWRLRRKSGDAKPSGEIEDSKIGIAKNWIVKDQEADSMNDLLNWSYNISGINNLWTSPTMHGQV